MKLFAYFNMLEINDDVVNPVEADVPSSQLIKQEQSQLGFILSALEAQVYDWMQLKARDLMPEDSPPPYIFCGLP